MRYISFKNFTNLTNLTNKLFNHKQKKGKTTVEQINQRGLKKTEGKHSLRPTRVFVPRGFCVPSVGGGLDDKLLPVVHPPLCSSQVLIFMYLHKNAVLEEVLYPPPESDQVHCCFLVDLDVPRLPQDLLHGVNDPPLTLELDGLASPPGGP